MSISQDVCWLSSHQLLIVTTDTNLPKGVWKGYAETLDTDTHTSVAARHLSQAC